MVGKVCKNIALISLLLGTMGSLLLLDSELGVAFFLCVFFCEVIFCITLYALGEIVDKLTEIAENTKTNKRIEGHTGVKREIKTVYRKEGGVMDIPKRNEQGGGTNGV